MAVRRVVIDDRVAPAKRQAERELERAVQARTMRVGNDFEPQLSREDEQRMTDEIREREDAAARQRIREQNALVDQRVKEAEAAVERLRSLGVDKRSRKELQRMESALERFRHLRTQPL